MGAVVKAIENFPPRCCCSWRTRQGPYQPLGEALKAHGKAAFAFGRSGIKDSRGTQRLASCGVFPDLATAFEEALAVAEAGDVVLLSPACSSFDQYDSYAHRGDHFKGLVRALSD